MAKFKKMETPLNISLNFEISALSSLSYVSQMAISLALIKVKKETTSDDPKAAKNTQCDVVNFAGKRMTKFKIGNMNVIIKRMKKDQSK